MIAAAAAIRPIQVLPSRGIAVDSRAAPTVAGDAAARRSFLGYIPGLLEGGLERGVLSCRPGARATVVASLVRSGTTLASRQAVGRGRAVG